MWMNEYEIDDAAWRFAEHPVVGPATHTLLSLVLWTNRNSDGWPYWQKPARAADRLMDLVQDHDRWERGYGSRPGTEATPAALATALRPLKAFRTRQGADFLIFASVADIEAEQRRRATAAETAERAELARLQEKYTTEGT